jgi:hypothetical protein
LTGCGRIAFTKALSDNALMYSTAMTIALDRVGQRTLRAQRPLVLPLFVWRIAMTVTDRLSARVLRRIGQELSTMVLSVAELSIMVQAHLDSDAALDADGLLLASLQRQRDGALQIQQGSLSVVTMAMRTHHPATLKAAREVSKVACELAEALGELYWGIGEHDASFAPRREGFVASTPEEVNAVLDRIMAGE